MVVKTKSERTISELERIYIMCCKHNDRTSMNVIERAIDCMRDANYRERIISIMLTNNHDIEKIGVLQNL